MRSFRHSFTARSTSLGDAVDVKQLACLVGLVVSGELAGVIAAFVAHGRREAARTALELTAMTGCVLVIGLALLSVSASIPL